MVSIKGVGGQVHTMEEKIGARTRRRHSDAFKMEAINACLQPGVSTAAVALRYGLDANLLRR